ncbi:MAG TPA: fused MFS/spermidine synthase [Actinotalea sp.]|nr:fused MFS/spermidine synthase [Actinotalea sp.]
MPIDTGTVEVQVDRGDPRSVTVLVNGVPSSPVHLDDPTRLDFEYLQVMAAVLDRLDPGPLDAVHLGAGACALPRWVEATRPGSRQLAIDVDGALLTLVRRWFDLPRSPRLRLRAGDARAVLGALPAASADVIVRDVFAGERTPVPLTTVEMVRQVVRVLRPGGLYLVNCADRPPLALARAELATLGGQMPEVALAVEPGILRGRRYGNLVLAATAEPPSSAGSVDRTSTRSAPLLVDPGLARTLRSLPVPVRLLHGTELDAFVGRAVPLRDVPTTTEAAPP